MGLNTEGVAVPAGSDAFNPQGDMVTLAGSLAGRIIVPVANQTARDSLSTSMAPSVGTPLYVWREDLKIIEWNDGSGFTAYPPNATGTWGLAADQTGIVSGAFTVLAANTAVGTPSTTFSNSAGAVTISATGVYAVSVQSRWVGVGSATVSRRSYSATLNCASINGSGLLVAGMLVGANVAMAGTVDLVQSFATPPFSVTAGDVLRMFAFHDAGVNATVAKGNTTDYQGQTLVTLRRVA